MNCIMVFTYLKVFNFMAHLKTRKSENGKYSCFNKDNTSETVVYNCTIKLINCVLGMLFVKSHKNNEDSKENIDMLIWIESEIK